MTASLDHENNPSLLLSNKQACAELHDYDMIVVKDILTKEGSNASFADLQARRNAAMFTKPLAILNVFSTGLYEWIWWLDMDALIMEMSYRLHRLMPPRNADGEWLADAVFSQW